MQNEFVTINIMIDRAVRNNICKNIKCSASSLNNVIKWTSSKYNNYKKPEVIKDILNKVKINDNIFWKYECGSYAEGNHNRGKSYVLYIKDYDNIFIICIYELKNIKVYKLKVD